MPPAGSQRSARLIGRRTPRLFTPPLRPLTRKTSRGYSVIDFCEMIGEPLLPWQKWLVVHGLELNPDGTYRFRVVLVLVARQNGKTVVKRRVSLWRLFVDDARLVIGAAQDLSLARDVWQECIDDIEGNPELAPELDTIRRVNGDEWFRLTSAARYMIKATNRKAGRGRGADEVNIDELREQQDWKAWSALSKTTMARARGQLWAMSNAGDDESVVLNQLRAAALAGRDPTLGLFEWSAPDGCALDDRKAWAGANPGLGHVISEQAIASALATDPPTVFRTEVLCQRVDALDSAIDLAAWRDCSDPGGTMTGVREQLACCVEVAEDGEHVTLVAAAPTRDGRIRIEVVAAWADTKQARFQLPAAVERVKPAAFAWFPAGPAAALAPTLRRIAEKIARRTRPKIRELKSWPELGGQKAAEACQGLADLVNARQVVHAGDPLLKAHLAAARKQHSGDGWRFVRLGGGPVDAAWAAAGAAYVAQTLPAPARPRLRMIS